LEAKLAALQSQLDKQSAAAKAIETRSCELCGDERHAYAYCPQRTNEGEVKALNNMSSYFPKPPFTQSYSSSAGDRQNWKDNPDRPHYGQGNNNNRPFISGQVQLNQEFKSFMHEQGKINMIILEELQKIREAQIKGSAPEEPKLPTKPVPNPSEECKAIHVLRSGNSYADRPHYLFEL
jgi:hypothetical protein